MNVVARLDLVKSIFSEESEKTCVVAVPPIGHLSQNKRSKQSHSNCRILQIKRQTSPVNYGPLTRVAHAQREIGLALGEQATAGYPPSAISLLPKLIERLVQGH